MPAAHFLIHFLGAQTVALRPDSFDASEVFSYGHELLWTDQMTLANSDRFGRCRLLDLLDDEPAQVAERGRVVFRRGPWPKGLSRLEPGSPAWSEAREAARQEAHKIEDQALREAALRDVRREYGDLPTGRTVATYGEAR